MLTKVQTLYAALSHQPADDSQLPLLRAAIDRLTLRLRPGLTPADCGEAFPLAAAWLAMADAQSAGEGVESFTAGAVTLRTGDAAARRQALRLQAHTVMKPYLKDGGFLFLGVGS